MKLSPVQFNLILAWAWILLGFLSGMALGMFFHRENWLGGYASLKRRMYRLCHISFFGLGAVNLFFWLTVKDLSAPGANLGLASWAFALGAITMPICCVLMAHWPKTRPSFAVPVVSLIAGGVLTLFVINSSRSATINSPPSALNQP